MNHEIQLMAGGSMTPGGSSGLGDLDRAPGAPTNVIGHSSTVITPAPTSDLEDPPGLYEKVSWHVVDVQ